MNLRAQTRTLLVNFETPHRSQLVLRDEFVRYLDAHEDALWKPCEAGHITASGLIFEPVAQRVLLTLHPKVGRWLQTGGHCEIDDHSLATTALREATEESGINRLRLFSETPIRLDAHPIDCRKDGGTIHFDVQFLVIAPNDAVTKISEESLDLKWFPVDQLPGDSDTALINLVTDAIAALRQ